MPRTCALYRFFDDDGVLLYVGITVNLQTRLRTHARKGWHTATRRITVDWFDTTEAARDAERHAIKTERPLYNVMESAVAWDEAVAAGHIAELVDRVTNRNPGERLPEAITAAMCARPELIDLPSVRYTKEFGYNPTAIGQAKMAARRALGLPLPVHLTPERLARRLRSASR